MSFRPFIRGWSLYLKLVWEQKLLSYLTLLALMIDCVFLTTLSSSIRVSKIVSYSLSTREHLLNFIFRRDLNNGSLWLHDLNFK
jgi:hypothetical protein